MSSELSIIATAFIEQRPALERFIVRRTGSRDAGCDLVQEIWLRVQDLPREQVERPVPYLFRMAGNLAIDWLRHSRAVSRHVSGEPVSELAPDDDPSPEEAVQSQQEYDILCAAIRELPPKCREVFLLYRADGLTMLEISHSLGIAAKTVEHHIARAMLHCRRRLREAGRAV